MAKLPPPNPASLVNIWPAVHSAAGGQDEHQGEAGHDLLQAGGGEGLF